MSVKPDRVPCGILSFLDDGKIVYANAALLAWLEADASAVVGSTVESLLPVASRIFYQTHLFPMLKIAGEVNEVYFSLRTRGGQELPMLVNAARHVDENGPVNTCAMLVVRQRSKYEDEILHARRTAEEARLWLSTTLQSIGDAVIATDADGRIVLVNPVAVELTGWTQSEAMGRPLDEVFVIINEETLLPVESPAAKVLREKRVVGLANHTLLVNRNGRNVPIDDSGAPIVGANGELLGVVLVFRDFTERRHSEQLLQLNQTKIESLNQRLQRAMTETHHRVKNNLQVISALVDMQITSGVQSVPASEVERLSHHIRGLAVVHDLLTHQAKQSEQSDTLSVRVTLEQLFPILRGMARDRKLLFEGDDCFLPVRQVTSLAVLANELVSNATKHGRGDIEIAFTIEAEMGVFEVRDRGDGFPEGFQPAVSANTGVELVETICRHDLKGSAIYSNRPGGGASVSVRFPLDRLESAPPEP